MRAPSAIRTPVVRLAAAALALALPAAVAGAQYNYVWVDAGVGLRCPSGSPAFQDGTGTVALATRCTVPGPLDPTNPLAGPGPFFRGSAEGANGGGILRTGTAAQILANDPSVGGGIVFGGSGRSLAAWDDRLAFGAGSALPAFADLTVTVHGLLDASVDPGFAGGTAGAGFQASLFATGTGATVTTEVGASLAFAYGCPTCVARRHLEDVWTLSVRVPTVGATGVDVSFLLALNAGVGIPTTGVYGPVTDHSASADFTHTAALSGVRFYDALGRDITGDVVYTFGNGTVVGPPAPTTVPEPGPLAPVGVGLTAVACCVQRRRAHRLVTSAHRRAGATP